MPYTNTNFMVIDKHRESVDQGNFPTRPPLRLRV